MSRIMSFNLLAKNHAVSARKRSIAAFLPQAFGAFALVLTLHAAPVVAQDQVGHTHGATTTSLPTTSTEAEAFVAAVKSEPETPAHAHDAVKAGEHAAILRLFPRAEATHVAVANGSWFKASTWYQGRVPDAGAKVLIPSGVSVVYDGESDISLFTVRVDGALRFATDRNTKMVVDTLFVGPKAEFQIGTAEDPVDPDVRAEILIANNGDIDLAWDPLLLSRGLVSHGKAEIFGAKKTAFLKVAKAPLRGDTDIELAKVPDGWRVGDTIIITGTMKRGWAWDNDLKKHMHHPTQDEVLTITAINGSRVTIDRPLRFHHATPRADLFAYVANMTRNVVIASIDGPKTPIQQRGHVMFMHGHDVDIRYASFNDLGRTDKSREASDIGTLASVSADSNIKGRYSFHFHRTGVADQQSPALAIGNTVSGSPGWGFVHHSSNADFIDNVAYNVFGAAFAAEDGDETGIWLRNMAILSQGYDAGEDAAKQGVERHDNGRTGDGFFFAGRLVEAAENVAANTTHGFVWMHRSAPSGPAAQTLDHPEIAYGSAAMEAPEPPIQGFRDNEAFGTHVGLLIIKANPAQGHDVRSVLNGFLNWETQEGVNISYSGHYSLENFDLLGTQGKDFFAPGRAVYFGANAFGITMNGLKIERFAVGVNMEQGFTFDMPDQNVDINLIDVQMTNVQEPLVGFDDRKHRSLSSSELALGKLDFVPEMQELGPDQDLSLIGVKTDSLGQTGRETPADPQTVYRWEVPDMLKAVGYYTSPEGRLIALIPDFVADRATGRLKKFSYPVVLAMDESSLQGSGAPYHGSYDPSNAAPIAAPDAFTTDAGAQITIDPTVNDSDPEGATVTVAGTTDPVFGEIWRQEDGSLAYKPYDGFSGTDSFTYWAGDDMGNFTPETVTIEVRGF